MKVKPPGQNPNEAGIPTIEVVEVVLDSEGKALDKITGQYLKLVPEGDDHILMVGSPYGRYLTLSSDFKLQYW
jgi:hypothetical protein